MIKIEKRISLDFFGESYADSYVVFEAIPVREYENIQSKIATIQETNNNQEAMAFMVNLLSDRLVRGEIAQDGKLVELTKDDLLDMPGEFFTGVMERLTGQDPKA
jgi:hypothetical protein